MKSLLFWMASIAINHPSNWMIDTMDVRILNLHNELFITRNKKKQKKRWYRLCLLLPNKSPKTWIISKLMLQNRPFRILFQFHHSLCVETYIHSSHTAHKNCLCNSFLKQRYAVTPYVHLSVTILSTLVLCIHLLYPLSVAAAHIYNIFYNL